jgi:CRISPR-associated protein Cas1
MTLKGKQNHYNVKLLSGYGISIKQKNNQIILQHQPDPFSEPDKEEWFVNNLPYEKLVVSGNGYITFDALKSLAKNNRNIILTDTSGHPVCLMNGLMNSLTATKYRMGQYDTFRDESKRQYLANQITKAKIESQSKFLKSHGVDIKLSHLESTSSRKYFSEYSKLIPEKYQFHSRNQSFIRNAKNHATDIINALLNYGYSVLAGEISKFVWGVGLDPYFGFMHKTHTGFQPLVYDLIEPFRWMVDEAVLSIAKHKDSRYRIKLKDYAFAKNGQVVIEYRLKQNFLEKLERLFQKERRYEFRHGIKTKDGLKSVQEITIVKIVVTNLAEFCLTKKHQFEI